LSVTDNPSSISDSKYIFITLGTPIDEYSNPKINLFLDVIKSYKKFFKKEHIIIIRSSVYPNICMHVNKILGEKNKWHIAYCPERIVQGYSIKELNKLPQIISGFTKKSIKESERLFKKITSKTIVSSVKEAELSKLFCNSLRYIEFAIANQFYMISEDFGVNFDNVRQIMTYGYDRAKMLPSAGFSAGPCLLKDTMQLYSFNHNNFLLGQASMMVNEGLPNFVVKKIKQKYKIDGLSIGILGMSFKANIDDTRDSLSYKLKKNLLFNNAKVYCSDEFVKEKNFISKNALIKKCKVIIIGTPHSAYKKLKIPKNKIIVDLWGITKRNNI
jgi:UDP-N-acetyl-D-mannosaminuronic acid dehydrogenase